MQESKKKTGLRSYVENRQEDEQKEKGVAMARRIDTEETKERGLGGL